MVLRLSLAIAILGLLLITWPGSASSQTGSFECGQQIIVTVKEPSASKHFAYNEAFQAKAEVTQNAYLDRVIFRTLPTTNRAAIELGTVWVTANNTQAVQNVTLNVSSLASGSYTIVAKSEHYIGPGAYKSCESPGVAFTVDPAPTSGGSGGGGSGGSTGSTDPTTWMSTALKNCLIGIYGQSRFDAIYINHATPTQTENEQAMTCWNQYGATPTPSTPYPTPVNTPTTAYQSPGSTTASSSPSQTAVAQTTTRSAQRSYASPQRFEPDPVVENCLRKVTGQRYESIKAGRARPNEQEEREGWACFSQNDKALPAVFIPIPPAKMKNLPVESKKIEIKQLEDPTEAIGPAVSPQPGATATPNQAKVTIGGQIKDAPNKQIFLYVYSEPKVLTTKTDKNGDWTYAIKDPLEPGKHEVYVAFEKNNNQYIRSEPLIFEVAQAAAPQANQPGNPVVVVPEEPEKIELRNYLVAGAFLIITAILILSRILRNKRLSLMPDSTQSTEK